MVSTKRSTGKQRRLALIIAYDGAHFSGMQVQDNSLSVQGEIERALRIMYGYFIRIHASGRTDRGVHALGQVIHFDDFNEFSLHRILAGVNGITCRNISVNNVFHVNNDFHSRFQAISREYIYKIYNHPVRSPFVSKRAMWMPKFCKVAYIQEICSYLEGEHDFKSFCKTSSSDKQTTRFISEIQVKKDQEYIILLIRGNSFLHNMIRIIVGTIEYFNQNNYEPSRVIAILDAKDRTTAGPTATPDGLYLNKVLYSPALETYPNCFE